MSYNFDIFVVCMWVCNYFTNELMYISHLPKRIQSFQKKYDAACTGIMLILDARGLEDYSGPGYHHPKKPVEAPKDMECFPIMVSYPAVRINCTLLLSCFTFVEKLLSYSVPECSNWRMIHVFVLETVCSHAKCDQSHHGA